MWPGILAAVLLWTLRFGVKAAVPGFTGFGIGLLASFAAAFAVVVWWLLFSRARWVDRVGGLALVAAAAAATTLLAHESLGLFWLMTYGVPTFSVAFVAWAVASRQLGDDQRRLALVATLVLVGGVWTLLRTEGVSGDHYLVFSWRWTASAEERLLAAAASAPQPTAASMTAPAAPTPATAENGSAKETPAHEPTDARTADSSASPIVNATTDRLDWPGFRGPGRDGVVRGTARIETDWARSPVVEVWRRAVGPGWGSFAVSGGVIYTQEQRGPDEIVAAYRLADGEPVWTHRDAARFSEPMAGAGPRSTPAVRDGRVFTMGGTGILNALDAATGERLWSRDTTVDAGVTTPIWGFASSPLVVNGLVVVAASGRLVAYDVKSGTIRWLGAPGAESYSSPHLIDSDGIPQIVLANGNGIAGVSPADGARLWAYPSAGLPIVQPAFVGGDLLVAVGGDAVAGIPTIGLHRVAIARGSGGWTATARWMSSGLKPYFNDLVVHQGHAYGFDGNILAAIDLRTGERAWKGGRYGNGQLVLLPDQDVLLVLSEQGELVLVSATPEAFREIARRPALDGKTWNHPVVVGEIVLVRNGGEMAAFRLPRAGRRDSP